MTSAKDTGAKDTGAKDTGEKGKGRVLQAKGSVREAIGKITGNAAVEKQGLRESEAGAKQAEADHPSDTPIDTGAKD
ncbi:CsbD family protein [Sphingomonas ginsenosidivorax]|uniref:CsbD family protein n=1 Tax=Sphingomonas ginsenosidivorax TaxID=862135 RepID=A0A5C6U9E9_9SPHN|nr:CsbD family protein [Sphingomonas ginsenosidivorax]TXC69637.1 CsbD family protein [Sphingomonas ginsenosidivorax]